jgi:hypothetical protein
MDLLSCKQSILSYLPVQDLVKSPYDDLSYIELHHAAKDFMSKSNLALNLTKSEIDWINNLALYTSVTIKKSLPNWIHGYLLYDQIKKYATDSQKIHICYFETGTARAFSALVATKAILDSNKKPYVITCDRLNDDKSRYWNAIGDINGRRKLTQVLEDYKDFFQYIKFINVKSEKIHKLSLDTKIDIGFLDGSHTYRAVRREFNFIKQFQNSDSIVIFDDVSEKYPGVKKFVYELNGIKKIFDSELVGRKYIVYHN